MYATSQTFAELTMHECHQLAHLLVGLRAGHEIAYATVDDHLDVLRDTDVPEHPVVWDALFNLCKSKAIA